MGDLKVYVIAFIFKKVTEDFLHFPLLFFLQCIIVYNGLFISNTLSNPTYWVATFSCNENNPKLVIFFRVEKGCNTRT